MNEKELIKWCIKHGFCTYIESYTIEVALIQDPFNGKFQIVIF